MVSAPPKKLIPTYHRHVGINLVRAPRANRAARSISLNMLK